MSYAAFLFSHAHINVFFFILLSYLEYLLTSPHCFDEIKIICTIRVQDEILIYIYIQMSKTKCLSFILFRIPITAVERIDMRYVQKALIDAMNINTIKLNYVFKGIQFKFANFQNLIK